jgi:hypothetical protein
MSARCRGRPPPRSGGAEPDQAPLPLTVPEAATCRSGVEIARLLREVGISDQGSLSGARIPQRRPHHRIPSGRSAPSPDLPRWSGPSGIIVSRESPRSPPDGSPSSISCPGPRGSVHDISQVVAQGHPPAARWASGLGDLGRRRTGAPHPQGSGQEARRILEGWVQCRRRGPHPPHAGMPSRCWRGCGTAGVRRRLAGFPALRRDGQDLDVLVTRTRRR